MTQANLVIAAMDLKVVRLIRDAMRSADAGAGRATPLGPAPSPAARFTAHPEPRIEPRPVIHPTPRFEPRPVVHPRPAEAAPCDPPRTPEMPRGHKCPIQPPWALVPWEIPPQPAPKVKLVIKRPDVVQRGRLLDVFI